MLKLTSFKIDLTWWIKTSVNRKNWTSFKDVIVFILEGYYPVVALRNFNFGA